MSYIPRGFAFSFRFPIYGTIKVGEIDSAVRDWTARVSQTMGDVVTAMQLDIGDSKTKTTGKKDLIIVGVGKRPALYGTVELSFRSMPRDGLSVLGDRAMEALKRSGWDYLPMMGRP